MQSNPSSDTRFPEPTDSTSTSTSTSTWPRSQDTGGPVDPLQGLTDQVTGMTREIKELHQTIRDIREMMTHLMFMQKKRSISELPSTDPSPRQSHSQSWSRSGASSIDPSPRASVDTWDLSDFRNSWQKRIPDMSVLVGEKSYDDRYQARTGCQVFGLEPVPGDESVSQLEELPGLEA
jgi:hypothetical protein